MERLRTLLDDPQNIGESRRASLRLLEDTDGSIDDCFLAISGCLSTNDLDQRTHQLFLALVSRFRHFLCLADVPGCPQHLCRFVGIASIKWVQACLPVSNRDDLSAQRVDDVGVFTFDVPDNHGMDTECLGPQDHPPNQRGFSQAI